MAQKNQDLEIFSNTDISIRITDIINESTGNIVAVADIFGATWGFTPYQQNVEPLVTKTMASGAITVPQDGVVLVRLDNEDTQGLTGEFTHELRLNDAYGTQVACTGKLKINYQVVSNPT